MEVRYCICKHCGNIVEKVKDKGVPVICCGEPMQELKAGVTDAAVEKHVPVYQVQFQRFDTIKKKHWSATTVAAIVRDEIYIGTRIWGKKCCEITHQFYSGKT